MRWITPDYLTAEQLRATLSADSQVDVQATESVLREAIAAAGASVVLLPGRTPDEVIMVRLEKNTSSQADEVHDDEPTPVAFQTGGFLGLSDEPVYEDETPVKKRWWN